MEITHSSQLHKFLSMLGERCTFSANIYIFGGSAILLIGGARHTGDLDFTIHSADDNAFRDILQSLANENGIDAEESIPSEFMPLPSSLSERAVFRREIAPVGYAKCLKTRDFPFLSDKLLVKVNRAINL